MGWRVPYPGGIDSFILLADNLRDIQQIEPNKPDLAGGFWVSAAFTRGGSPLADYTIKRVSFEADVGIASSAVNIKVYVNPNGSKSAGFVLIKTIVVDSSPFFGEAYPNVTGRDPRVKLEMNPSLNPLEQNFSIHNIEVEIIERAKL